MRRQERRRIYLQLDCVVCLVSGPLPCFLQGFFCLRNSKCICADRLMPSEKVK
nr:MAG TPA: Bacteriocin subtilosin A [Caudoviricetes sp.]